METSQPHQLSKQVSFRTPTYSLYSSAVQKRVTPLIAKKGFQNSSFTKKNKEYQPSINRLSPKSYFDNVMDQPLSKTRQPIRPNLNRRNSATIQNETYDFNYVIDKAMTAKNISTKNSPTSSKTYETMKNIGNSNLQQRRKNFFQTMNQRKITYKPHRQQFRNLNGDNFDIIKILGKGKYGKVFLVKQKCSGFIMALKVVQKKLIMESDLLEQFIRQIKIQFYLDHPGIIKLYGFFQDEKNLYLLMQLGCDGELYHYTNKIGTFREASASYIAKNLLTTFKYIHSKKIMHRDLKPENIVVVMGTLKLCDFGWAVHNSFEMRSTFCGTPLYFSPQLISGKSYDQKIDLWAIGVMIYQLVLGKSPFNLQKPDDLPKIVTDAIDFPKQSKISEQFREFIQKILQKNPNKRRGADSLLNCKFIMKYKDAEICEQLCKKLKK